MANNKGHAHKQDILAGPLGHELHPILVTIPIGAWVIEFEVLERCRISSLRR